MTDGSSIRKVGSVSKVSKYTHQTLADRNRPRAWIASSNQGAQEQLLLGFAIAMDDGNYSLAMVADSVGATPDVVEAALSGATDLNLTEIRHLAIAMNSVVEYRVVRAADIEDRQARFLAVSGLSELGWEEMPQVVSFDRSQHLVQ